MFSPAKSKRKIEGVHLEETKDNGLLTELSESSEDENESRPRKLIRKLPNHRELIEDELWTVKFAPETCDQLALNPRKLKELRSAFNQLISGDKKLLLLTGPAGVSKSAATRCLAKELKCNIVEWQSPVTCENSDSVAASFSDFLAGAKFRGPGLSENSTTIFVAEDLPNISHPSTRKHFNNCIFEWLHAECRFVRLPPLVIILTEVQLFSKTSLDDCIIAERVISNLSLEDPHLIRVKFQPVARTYLLKALNRVVSLCKLRVNQSLLEPTIQALSDFQDVRASISALEFWVKSPSHTLQKHHANRALHLDVFHATGKVVYGSKTQSEEELIKAVSEEWQTSCTFFTLCLLENYCTGSDQLSRPSAACASWLSLSDLLVKKDEAIASQCGIRGLRVNLQHVTSGSRGERLVYPREFKVDNIRDKHIRDRRRLVHYLAVQNSKLHSFDEVVLWLAPYRKIIKRETVGRQDLGYDSLRPSTRVEYVDSDELVPDKHQPKIESAETVLQEDPIDDVIDG